jgi:hypothetical protein
MSTSAFRQPPSVIEGSGDAYASALSTAGVTTLAEMLRLTRARIERLVPTVPAREINRWFASAWLLRVDEVDPNIAEAFVAAGITSVNELADAGLQTLERAMSRAMEEHKLGSAPSVYKLAEMQRSAARLRSTGSVYGTATNLKTGEPLAGVLVSSSHCRTETGADGYFELHGVDAGRAHVNITPPFRGRSTYRFIMKTDVLYGPLTLKITEQSARKPAEPVREVDGAFVGPGRATTVKFLTRTLEEMPDNTYFRVREINDSGGARLLHLYRPRVGREIQADVVNVGTSNLPPGTKLGHVLHYQDGRFQLTTLTLRDIATRKLEAKFGKVTLKTLRQIAPKLGS